MLSRSNRSAWLEHFTTKKKILNHLCCASKETKKNRNLFFPSLFFGFWCWSVFFGPRIIENEMQMSETEINDILYAGFDIRFI